MAWLLNKCMNLKLEYIDPLEIQGKGGKSAHTLYQCKDEEQRVQYSLISNRSNSGFLIPEYPQTDFILKIEEAEEAEFLALKSEIRGMNQVLLVHDIDPVKLKSGVNLVF